MEPNLTPQPTGGGQAQPQQNLDPSVVALTKAIGKAESGGKYNAPSGDPGSPPSAYQFTPGFLKEWGPKAGVQWNPSVPLTPEQQDKIAYTAVETMGTKGDPAYPHLGKLTPAQIASAWNAGDPNAYLDPEYGKNNAYGSTQNYVNKISQIYDKENPTAQTPSTPSPTPQSSMDASTALGIGGAVAGGGLLATLLSGGEDLLAPLVSGAEGLAGDVGTWLAGLGGKTLTSGGSSGNSSDSSPSQPQTLAQIEASLPAVTQSSKALQSAQNEALKSTVGGRNMTKDPNFVTGINTNAKYGFAPQVDENGAMNWQEATQKSKDAVEGLSNSAKNFLFSEGTSVPVQQAKEEAYANIEKYVPVPDQEAAKKHVDEFADSYAAKLGDGQGNMSLGHYQQMKQEMGKAFDKTDTNAKTAAKKALSHGARRTIEKNTKNPDLYNRVMKEEQGLINGQKIMKRLEGRKAPKNQHFLKSLNTAAARYLEIYIGDKLGGPMGAVLGGLVGDFLLKGADKKYGKTIFETPAVHSALKELQDKKPAIYDLLSQELKKNGIITPRDLAIDSKEGDKAGYTLQEMLKQNLEKKGRIKGKSTGFPAKQPQKAPSPALQALMKRDIPISKGLKNLKRPLPQSQRKGQMVRV